MTRYPYVACGTDGRRLGYIVCRHVEDGATVAHIVGATRRELGEVFCDSPDEHDIAILRVICEGCCLRAGWLKAIG
jgi:hypothetical protein